MFAATYFNDQKGFVELSLKYDYEVAFRKYRTARAHTFFVSDGKGQARGSTTTKVAKKVRWHLLQAYSAF
jgi:hypothetical protein